MKLLLSTNCNNDETVFGCEYALIDLTPPLIDLIKKRFAMVDELNRQDETVDRISFVDYGPVWFDPYQISDEMGEQIEELNNTGPWINGDFRECEIYAEDLENGTARTESDRMIVSEWFVWWSCEPKHSGYTVETCLIDRKMIDPTYEKPKVTAA